MKFHTHLKIESLVITLKCVLHILTFVPCTFFLGGGGVGEVVTEVSAVMFLHIPFLVSVAEKCHIDTTIEK